ncbi:hypothetical protein [Fodinibius salsisoli]|uniref:Lipoprotein n=1 Tax=Fodinibius salsisoli TaxID=2820877 RepID=A0ABT3PNQ4_9BACT|nr:hypothetical protein [Fodinibius salsisoli]MCW9707491.1 hypothetical protein [Fodinibius salsisoli]
MKLFYTLTAILVTAIMVGCSSPNDANVYIGANVDFFFVNEQGEDLLDPDHPNAITEKNTDLYYLEDGERKKVFEGHLDSPKKFSITSEKRSGKNWMRVFTNLIPDQDTTTTYLQFSDFPEDTIRVQYGFTDNSTYIRKIWYNGELKLDIDWDEQPQVIKIVKSTN